MLDNSPVAFDASSLSGYSLDTSAPFTSEKLIPGSLSAIDSLALPTVQRSAVSDSVASAILPVSEILQGTDSNDTLRGGKGDDTLTGGKGGDLYVLAAGDSTDTLTDFNLKEKDLIGLADGLTYEKLTIAPGTGSSAGDTLIRVTSTGEVLAITQGCAVQHDQRHGICHRQRRAISLVANCCTTQLVGRAVLPAATFAPGATFRTIPRPQQ